MRSSKLRILIVAGSSALAVVLSSPLAVAQSPADLNRAAGALFEKGDFQAAARLLEVVLKLQPSAKAHRNLALCYAKIPRREEKAVLHMQAYLRARPQARDREKAERMIADLEERIARKGSSAFVESVPAGARVFLDDAPHPLGRTPLRTRLPLGEHTLRLERAGFETIRRTVRVELHRQLQLAFALTPANLPGYLLVRADLPDARVTLDGRPARLGRNTVNPGAHQVRVTRKGRKPWEAEIRIRPGATTEVVARLPVAPLPTSPPPPPRPYRVWKWLSLGLATVATALSIIGYSRAVMDRNRADGLDGQGFATAEDFQAALAREERSANRNIDLSRIALGGAVATAVTTAVLFYLDRRGAREASTRPPPRPRLGLAPIPGGALAFVRAEF